MLQVTNYGLCAECRHWTPSGGWTTGICEIKDDVTDGTDHCRKFEEGERVDEESI